MSDFLVALLIYGIGVAVSMMLKKGKERPPILRQPYERRSTDIGPRPAPGPAETSGGASGNMPGGMPVGTSGRTPDGMSGGMSGNVPAGNEPEEDSEGTTLEGDFRTDWREDASDPEGVSLEGRDLPEINKAEKGDEQQSDREFQPFDTREFGATSTGDVQGEWKEEELAWDQAIREDAGREIPWDGEASAPAEAVGAAGVAGAVVQRVPAGAPRLARLPAAVEARGAGKGLWPTGNRDIIRGFVFAEILRPPLALRRGRR